MIGCKVFRMNVKIFTEDGRFEGEIETRTRKANVVSYQLAPLLKHVSIPMETQAKLINVVFSPTLTCQCQSWTLTKRKTKYHKITTCEMRCLHKAVNKTGRDTFFVALMTYIKRG